MKTVLKIFNFYQDEKQCFSKFHFFTRRDSRKNAIPLTCSTIFLISRKIKMNFYFNKEKGVKN